MLGIIKCQVIDFSSRYFDHYHMGILHPRYFLSIWFTASATKRLKQYRAFELGDNRMAMTWVIINENKEISTMTCFTFIDPQISDWVDQTSEMHVGKYLTNRLSWAFCNSQVGGLACLVTPKGLI